MRNNIYWYPVSLLSDQTDLTQFSFFFVSDEGEDEMALSSSTILSLVASTSLSMSPLPYPVVSMGFRTLWKGSLVLIKQLML